MINKKVFWISLLLLGCKFLYMFSVALMLPDQYLIWTFYKNINLLYACIEMVPFILGLLVLILGYKPNSVYSFSALLMFIMYFIPANSGLSLSGNNYIYFTLINIFCILMLVAFSELAKRESNDIYNDTLNDEQILTDKRKVMFIRLIMIFISLLSIFYVYYFNGLNFSALFSDMYETRVDFTNTVAEAEGTFVSYFVLIVRSVTKWFLPIYLVFSLKNKRVIDTFLCLFTFVALYTVTLEKSTLMIVGVAIFIAIVDKKDNLLNAGVYLALLFFVMFIISLIEYLFRGESLIFTLIIRRMFYIPQYMTQIHYDYYSTGSKMWFSQDAFLLQNIVRVFFGSPYTNGTTKVISNAFFQGLIPSPNSGGFSEAYSQMGSLGVIVFPFIYAGLFKRMRKCASWYGSGAALVVMVRLVLSVTGVHLLASSEMIGFILFFIITYVFRNFYQRKATKLST